VIDAAEDVEERTLPRGREPDAIGGHDRHAIGAGQLGQRFVVALLVAKQMALQLDVHTIATEETDHPIEHAADTVASRVEDRTAGERDESGREAIELAQLECAFSFRRAHLHARHEPTEILIPLGR
jgi:hypothetical protein